MIKAEAVARLRDRGFHAFERDWAMGETIGVAADPETKDGITVYRKLVYIARCDRGWIAKEIGVVPSGVSDPEVTTLDAACARAEAILTGGGGVS